MRAIATPPRGAEAMKRMRKSRRSKFLRYKYERLFARQTQSLFSLQHVWLLALIEAFHESGHKAGILYADAHARDGEREKESRVSKNRMLDLANTKR